MLATSQFLACFKSPISARLECHLELHIEFICSLFTILSMKYRQHCTLHKLALNANNRKNSAVWRQHLLPLSDWLLGMCVIRTPYTSFNLKVRVFWAHLWFWESFRLEPDGAGWDKGTVASWGTVNTCLSFPGSRTSSLPLMRSLCTLSSSSCQPVPSGLHTECVGSGQQWTFIAQLYDRGQIAMHNFVI